MITITNASIYTANGEMAHALTYSDGTEVRVVESAGNIIRKEYKKKDGQWAASGKPYVVVHNRKRQAEHLKQTIKEFLAA